MEINTLVLGGFVVAPDQSDPMVRSMIKPSPTPSIIAARSSRLTYTRDSTRGLCAVHSGIGVLK